MTEYKQGKTRDKIPIPPAGFVPTKFSNGGENGYPPCPYCNKRAGWHSGVDGFTDKGAQEFCDSLEDEEGYISFDDFCKEYEGEMIKCHWSRFNTWVCDGCGGIVWYDWDMGYEKNTKRYYYGNHYWKPADIRKPNQAKEEKPDLFIWDGKEYVRESTRPDLKRKKEESKQTLSDWGFC